MADPVVVGHAVAVALLFPTGVVLVFNNLISDLKIYVFHNILLSIS